MSLAELLKHNTDKFGFVLPTEILLSGVKVLDLSENNSELKQISIFDVPALDRFIFSQLEQADAALGVGGYNEIRGWYSRSDSFNLEGEPRDVHIGIDLWISAGTPVLAPIDATLHSFANNSAGADYGPTVILEHILDSTIFYTLYGHLSTESLTGKSAGQVIKRGDPIGAIGQSTENGNWPPHLHFQVIGDMLGKQGDFFGVISRSKRKEFLKLCPDPNLILQLPGLTNLTTGP